jgi:hypothetical protein
MISAASLKSPGWLLGSLIAVVVLAIAAAVGYSFVTRKQTPEQSSIGIVRPLLALMLVGGLLILAGASFTLDDGQTRNLLTGGIVASSASAVAFYFASRGAESARKDLLNAALGTETVPKLIGMTLEQAQAAISSLSLMLKAPATAQPTDAVSKQDPEAGSTAQRGSTVTVAL